MKKGPYYLAMPYQGTEEEQAERAALALRVTIEFLRQGIHVFSPVTYSEPIAKEMRFSGLEDRRKIMMPYLLDFLKVSQGLILLKIEGWENSRGVNQEISFCQENDIPIYPLTLPEISGDLRAIFAGYLSGLE